MGAIKFVGFSFLMAISGCSALQSTVTWVPELPGATIVDLKTGQTLGVGPLAAIYNPRAENVVSPGCFGISGVRAVWPSGYSSSTSEFVLLCRGYQDDYLVEIPYRGDKHQSAVDSGHAVAYQSQIDLQRQQADQANAALWAAALVGVGNAAVNAKYPATTYAPAPNPYTPVKITPPPQPQKVLATTPTGCNSDFECGIGKKCVKGPLQGQGQCLTPVNQYGLPQPSVMPDPNSIKINTNIKGVCRFDTQCGVGFRCDQALKVCVQ